MSRKVYTFHRVAQDRGAEAWNWLITGFAAACVAYVLYGWLAS